jgi:hypothetical protein
LASSADGSILAVAAGDGGVYISTNSGGTWLEHTQSLSNAHIVTMAADGSRMAACASGLSTSSDGGVTWAHQTNAPTFNGYYNYNFIASSADGEKLLVANAAGTSGSPLFTSADGGVTWVTNNAPTNNWLAGASSADGTKLIAVAAGGGGVWTSTNSGGTWISNSVPPPYGAPATWLSAASSADGSKLVIGSYGGAIFTSTNSGGTWISNNVPLAIWQSVASSADGTKLAAVIYNGTIYTSTNSGATWNTNNLPRALWVSIASSADGGKLAAAISGGNVWTSQSTAPKPSLTTSLTDGNLTVSWPVSSTNLVLQSSSDLSSWTDLTNKPVFNLTNLQEQVTLFPTNSYAFFRLATP